jgi:hypothetical protein
MDNDERRPWDELKDLWCTPIPFLGFYLKEPEKYFLGGKDAMEAYSRSLAIDALVGKATYAGDE